MWWQTAKASWSEREWNGCFQLQGCNVNPNRNLARVCPSGVWFRFMYITIALTSMGATQHAFQTFQPLSVWPVYFLLPKSTLAESGYWPGGKTSQGRSGSGMSLMMFDANLQEVHRTSRTCSDTALFQFCSAWSIMIASIGPREHTKRISLHFTLSPPANCFQVVNVIRFKCNYITRLGSKAVVKHKKQLLAY